MFARILFFGNSFEIHNCHVKNLQPGHDLSISVNDGVISPFCKGFIFKQLCNCKVGDNKRLAKISEFTASTMCEFDFR